ncbi:MAG: DUF1189 family protein [Candidatus Gracilibacteria bacterium]|jgi:hypothetical protein
MSKKTKSVGFFKSIPSSIYSPSFYAGIPGQSFGKSFGYLAGFTALIVLLCSIFLVLVPYLTHRDQIEQSISNVLNFYPEELVVTIQDGKAHSNMQEPYYFRVNDFVSTEEWDGEFKTEFENGLSATEPIDLESFSILVVDTQTPFSLEQFKAYNTLAWLTQDSVVVKSEENRVESIALEGTPNTVLNKTVVDQVMNEVWSKLNNFIPFLVVLAFIGTFVVVMLARMFYLLILALVLMVVGAIMKVPYSFESSYKTAIYAVTLPTLLSAILLIEPWTKYDGFFLAFTLLSSLIVVINWDQAKKAGLLLVKAPDSIPASRS